MADQRHALCMTQNSSNSRDGQLRHLLPPRQGLKASARHLRAACRTADMRKTPAGQRSFITIVRAPEDLQGQPPLAARVLSSQCILHVSSATVLLCKRRIAPGTRASSHGRSRQTMHVPFSCIRLARYMQLCRHLLLSLTPHVSAFGLRPSNHPAVWHANTSWNSGVFCQVLLTHNSYRSLPVTYLQLQIFDCGDSESRLMRGSLVLLH